MPVPKSDEIGILDIGVGNINSIAGCLNKLGFSPQFVKDTNDLKPINYLILPGVGNMYSFIDRLKSSKLNNEILLYTDYGYLLGICLGFQALYEYSHESQCPCLGIFKGQIMPVRSIERKLTNVGYHSIAKSPGKFDNNLLNTSSKYFFIHSYYAPLTKATTHEFKLNNISVTAASSNGQNIYGVQFHPELSHISGRRFISNFLNLN